MSYMHHLTCSNLPWNSTLGLWPSTCRMEGILTAPKKIWRLTYRKTCAFKRQPQGRSERCRRGMFSNSRKWKAKVSIQTSILLEFNSFPNNGHVWVKMKGNLLRWRRLGWTYFETSWPQHRCQLTRMAPTVRLNLSRRLAEKVARLYLQEGFSWTMSSSKTISCGSSQHVWRTAAFTHWDCRLWLTNVMWDK